MYPEPIQKLIEIFSKFPTIGQRTASRFVFYLIRMSQEKFDELIDSLKKIRESIKLCPLCFKPFNPSSELKNACEICSNNSRNKFLLCIIEKEADLESIEKTKKYKGVYFILGGTIGLRKNRQEIRIQELKEKIKNNNFEEVIIATNPTPEGEATALFLERELKEFNLRLTRLGRGLPVGGELEYADEDTLESALQGRK